MIFRRFIHLLWQPIVIIGVNSVFYYLYHAWSYDDPYITYRYAQNLMYGFGFVYNPGEKILSTTTPLFALLLGLTGRLWPNIPQLAVFIGSLSIGFAAVLILNLAKVWGHPIAGWVSMPLIATFGLLSITLSSETPLYIALGLSVLYTYSIRRYSLFGFLSALLILTRPDGALLPIILGVHFLFWVREHLPRKGIAIFALVSLLGWGVLGAYFGSPIPVTLAAKQHQGTMIISQGFAQGLWTTLGWYRAQWFFLVECMLALLGLVHLIQKKSMAILLVGWTLLYFASYSLLGVTRYFWYYAPLVPGFTLLVGAGVERIYYWIARAGRSNILALAVSSLLVTGLFFFQLRHIYRQSFDHDQRIPLYTAAGNWIRENTPSESKVAAVEVGVIGFYSQRYIVDFAGLIQPDVARQMKPDSTYLDTAIYAMDRYDPDYLVVYQGFVKPLTDHSRDLCRQEIVFSGTVYGVDQDLMILHCAP